MRDEIDEVVVNQLAAAESGTEDALDPTLVSLRNDLANIQALLREPKPVDSLDDETEIRKIVAALAVMPKPTNAAPQPPSVTEHEPHAPDGELGQYQLLAVIGRGGMGAVYKARHRKLDKIVAVKVLPPRKLKDPHAIARFEREMRAVGKLQHPHIVAAHDAGEIDGTHYLVMELVDGIDLSALVKMHGPLPISVACELIRQAALGLQHASEQGLVHRDIKPSNLILAKSQRGLPPLVKVLDMGLALLDDVTPESGEELTSTGQVMGTIDYMAPEQSHDTHKVDIRADIYSLGATLYKLLTGRAPFADAQYDSVVKKLVALATQPIPDIRSLRSDCPAKLAAVIHKLLAKNPAERPSSPSEVANSLVPFAAAADLTAFLTETTAAAHAAEISLTGTQTSFDSNGPTVIEPRRNRTAIPHLKKKWPWMISIAVGLAVAIFFLSVPRRSAVVKSNSGSARSDFTGRENEAGLPNIQPSSSDVNRAAAEWVLSVGGTVTVVTNGTDLVKITQIADLPTGTLTFDTVDLSNCKKITVDGMTRLAQVASITDLCLIDSNISNDALAALAPLNSVKTMRLEGTPISDEGLCRFAATPKSLTYLFLNKIPLHLEGLAAILENCPNLENLYCPHLAFDASLPEVLSRGKSLKGIELDSVFLRPTIAASLFKSAPQIHELGISGPIDGEKILALKESSNLTVLTLTRGAVVAPDALRELSKLTSVKTLVLRIPLSRSELRDLASSCLERIWIYFPEEQQSHLEDLAECESLRALMFHGDLIDEPSLKQLITLRPDLEVFVGGTLRTAAPPTTDANRAAAEWALKIGGTVKLKLGDEVVRPITAIKDLPEGDFVVDTIDVQNNPRFNDADAQRFLTGLSCLTSLQIHHTSITDATLTALRDSATLENLHLEDTGVTDEGIRKLGHLPKLQLLMLNRTKITAECLSAVIAQPELRHLNIGSVPATKTAAKVLLASPRWWNLGLHESWIHPDYMARFAEQSDLGGLAIYGDLPVSRLRLLAGLPKLSRLTFVYQQNWSPELSLSLSSLSQLDWLELWGVKPSTGWKELATARPWRDLHFSSTHVPDELFDGLDRVDSLAVLRLTQTTQSRSRLQRFRAEHPKVDVISDTSHTRDRDVAARLLRLGGIEVEAVDQSRTHRVRRVEDLPDTEFQLHAVIVDDCPSFDDRMLASLAGSDAPHWLVLSKSSVTDFGLSILDQFPQLEDLTLASELMTPRGLHAIARVPRLERLYLVNCTTEQLQRLAPLKLRVLLFENIAPEEASPFLEQVTKQFPDLTSLGVGTLVLNAQTAESLRKLPKLAVLAGQSASLTAEVVPALAKHPSLRSLDLFGTHEHPWAGLATLQRIQTVLVGTNLLSDSHIERLAELPQLQTLTFDRCKVTPEALATLSKLRHVAKIRFEHCDLSDTDRAKIKEALPNSELAQP